MRSPRVLQLIMDSLRYWVLEMHVDGFRFDLASALARELHAVDKLGAFFDIIHQDPVLSQVKLIAEPWDLGEGGYQVGNFPPRWAEWNGKYRDTMRAFWRGDGGGVSELATRLSGSSDLYAQSGRLPYASVNFVTSHDGFTMSDLVSYERKHNEANQEGNRDGENHNLSWNCGIEGETDDERVNALRRKHRRNLMASLLLSHGVPMLSGGDEVARTQRGNNNAYCQDNEIGWTGWQLDAHATAFLSFVQRLIALRRSQPVLRRRRFFLGRSIRGAQVKDVAWLDTSAQEMTDSDWSAAHVRHLGVLLAGDAIDEVDERGRHIRGESLLLLLNADIEPVTFALPAAPGGGAWSLVFDTAVAEGATQELAVAGPYKLEAQATAVFRTG
jgi:glycogen operon protein